MTAFRRLSRSRRDKNDPALEENLRHQQAQPSFDTDQMRDVIEGTPVQKLSPGTVMQLQRTLGNRAVTQLLKGTAQRSPVIQRNPIKDKLTQLAQDGQQGQQINLLANHLLTIINAIDAKDWNTAYNMLYDGGVAGQVNHSIVLKVMYVNATNKTQEQIDKEVEQGISKGMYFDGKLNLPEVAVLPNNDFMQAISPATDARLAMKVLPVALEEWIHMFQHKINGFLSEATYRFEQSNEVQENLNSTDGSRQWNMNEVDIYATYKDLGWYEVFDAFRSRYEEREKFEDFINPIIPHITAPKRRAGVFKSPIVIGNNRT